ncbi:S-ribosylhomocysteine lyase [Anaerofustis stercorihominis]|uniref:S-ribosylhomocysteine lyase n=1 Tax=Anaerofustis stercorihominis TaxID=214853 RepID=A0A3E3E0A0_9FIRM|nr:S-ribosylhomocysteine lyase [Anaerofustis stercorihominis]RGD74913.1 S-ribosylhomocysteine lyase [Anaerofustis stercorihominis]
MEKIASFMVDHTKLEPGIYLSREDRGVITYDLRFIKPNTPPFLSNKALHTIEHLCATYLRNSKFNENVIYFGPMGCRTGFYLLTLGLAHKEVIGLVKKTISDLSDYEGPIPGQSEIECGNYKELDLQEAKKELIKYNDVIKDLTEKDIYYK